MAGRAAAQTRPRPAAGPGSPTFAVRGFGEAGTFRPAASRSFNAILGDESGPVYGGGGEVVLRSNWFFRVGAWRFDENGERAVRIENQTYRLGIPLTVTLTAVEGSAGYRFPVGRRRLFVPYGGVGVSSCGYKERSDFAEPGENVDERYTGYQVFGGVEYRLHRYLGLAGEVQYSTVPDSLGAGGLSAEFDETDLGGVILRLRVLFGR